MSYTTYTEDFIENLYTHLGIFLPNQLDLKEITFRLDIQLYYWKNPSQVLFYNDKAYIFLYENLSKQQMWQEFCHELCHALWHSGSQKVMPYYWIQYQEWKADNFMLHACVPTFMLKKLLLPSEINKAAQFISEQFNVEPELAYKRLQHYSDNHYEERYALLEGGNHIGLRKEYRKK